jgi:hypothetical protein
MLNLHIKRWASPCWGIKVCFVTICFVVCDIDDR